MTKDASALKEQIIRELLSLIQAHELGAQIEVGKLVLFLEKEWQHMLQGQQLSMVPLWSFCANATTWSVADFCEVLGPLETKVSGPVVFVWPEVNHHFEPIPPHLVSDVQSALMKVLVDSALRDIVRLDELDLLIEDFVSQASVPLQLEELWQIFAEEGLPPALLEEVFAGFSGSSLPVAYDLPEALASGAPAAASGDERHERVVIDVILDCMRQSPVNRIIDPEKLAEHLEEDIVDMWEDGSYNLQELWDILSEVDQISEEMLIHAFLLIEKREDEIPVKVWVPARVRNLPQDAKDAIVPPDASEPPKHTARPVIEPPKPQPPSQNLMRTGAFSSASTGSRPSPKTKEKKEKKTKAKPRKKGFEEPELINPNYVIIAVVISVVSLLVYFLFVYEGTPSFQGTPMSSVESIVKKYPVAELRIKDKFVYILTNQKYTELSDQEQQDKIFDLVGDLRKKNKELKGAILYSPDKRFINKTKF